MSALPYLVGGIVILVAIIAFAIWSEPPPSCRSCAEGGVHPDCPLCHGAGVIL